ncbi:MAG: sterol desaturase family protein [Melioribacteraceae bacterium]|nr:sterol desaturase family protein [Melioribacteraceae bacterium]MCF8263292.1 sterol desaturase family protein [Melioribacteraceae bacterium]MCF8413983.1 sterol desaturase family protein [Melioribacteraceae bacterium]MCF8431991.1 sterol desaturase family protein [Melioribacteraceae bacterium]
MEFSQTQLIGFGLLILGSLIIISLERIFPYDKGQKIFRKEFFLDFFWYNIFQSALLGIVIFSFIINYIDSTTGLSRFQIVTDWPVWVQLLFFTITHDLYIYLFHKWQHKNKFLWRLHEAHHSPKEVDWISGARSHAGEILINQTIEFLPIVLLGAPAEVVIFKSVISGVWGMWIHANVDVHSGKLQKYINGPEMHRWHHSTGKGRNRNFATKFAVWDWIFGTAYLPNEKPDDYGLKTEFPANYFTQLAFAFRPFKKTVRKINKEA